VSAVEPPDGYERPEELADEMEERREEVFERATTAWEHVHDLLGPDAYHYETVDDWLEAR
jgi:hypothetical protein